MIWKSNFPDYYAVFLGYELIVVIFIANNMMV